MSFPGRVSVQINSQQTLWLQTGCHMDLYGAIKYKECQHIKAMKIRNLHIWKYGWFSMKHRWSRVINTHTNEIGQHWYYVHRESTISIVQGTQNTLIMVGLKNYPYEETSGYIATCCDFCWVDISWQCSKLIKKICKFDNRLNML